MVPGQVNQQVNLEPQLLHQDPVHIKIQTLNIAETQYVDRKAEK